MNGFSFLFPQTVTGLELNIDSEGNYIWNYCVVKRSKNKVLLEKSEGSISDIRELFKNIDPANPVLLSVTGKGIIHKNIAYSEQDNFETAASRILPNAKMEDFYIQIFKQHNGTAWSSLIRKSVLDAVLENCKHEGIKIIDCVLGPQVCQSFIPLLGQPESEKTYQFSNFKILVNNGEIISFHSSPEDQVNQIITIAGLNIPDKQIIAFASAFSYFNRISQLSNNFSFVITNSEEYINELRFRNTGILALITFFTVLLINFIAFFYLSEQVASKSGRFSIANKKLLLADSLAAQVEQRRTFLTTSGLSQPSRTSYYADQIAAELPGNIRLTSLLVHPVIKNDDDKTKIRFESKKIILSGKSHFAVDVNEWLKLLRNKSWVNSVVLSNYNQKEGSDLGEFVIEINTK